MKELEIEFKNLLSKTQFLYLKDTYFKGVSSKVQRNYYIDTEDFKLGSQPMLLRVREINGSQMMTLKVPTNKGVLEFHGEVAVNVEDGARITRDMIPTIILEELKTYDIEINEGYVYGCLLTERFETQYKDGLLVLDKSTYLGKTDYELEYEVSDYNFGETHFFNLLEASNIERVEEVTKIERFYKRLYELKKES